MFDIKFVFRILVWLLICLILLILVFVVIVWKFVYEFFLFLIGGLFLNIDGVIDFGVFLLNLNVFRAVYLFLFLIK